MVDFVFECVVWCVLVGGIYEFWVVLIEFFCVVLMVVEGCVFGDDIVVDVVCVVVEVD